MTPNQRDMFMYTWSRSRKRGRLGNALLGAGVGALGGVLFGFMLAGDVSSNAVSGSMAAPSVQSLSVTLHHLVKLFGLAIPAFAFLGALGVDRIYRSQEAMYQNFIAQGAAPPATKPTLTTGERGPMIAVFIAAGILACCIAALWIAYG